MGGDINDAYFLSSNNHRFFLKVNTSRVGSGILRTESLGLKLLALNDIPVPSVILDRSGYSMPYLLLENIEVRGSVDSKSLAESLAFLHSIKSDYYGLDHDNYIGSLPQTNSHSIDMVSFLVENRYLPQIQRAKSSGFLHGIECHAFLKELDSLIPEVPPTLIHGDLWNGNLLSDNGSPIFIDPSVSYSHPEFDLGMMSLFGGFSDSTFDIYEEMNPMSNGYKKRSDIFQLYYLLVHLNIFGQSYEKRVREILGKYA